MPKEEEDVLKDEICGQLVYACKSGDLGRFKEILNDNKNLDLTLTATGDTYTLLGKAIVRDKVEIAREILSRCPALLYMDSAVGLGPPLQNVHSLEMAKLLVEEGANINECDIWRDSIIISMASTVNYGEYFEKRIIHYLIEQGADPYICDGKGNNFFYYLEKGEYASEIYAIINGRNIKPAKRA